jgi:hypothetical protein
LEKILFLAASLGAKQILLSNLAPEGNALKNFKSLAVSLDNFSKKIPALISLAKSKKVTIRFFGLPLCILGEYVFASNDLWWSPRLTLEREGQGAKETISLSPTRKRIKTKKCRLCIEKDRCGGIFEKYFREFGDKHLRPFLK